MQITVDWLIINMIILKIFEHMQNQTKSTELVQKLFNRWRLFDSLSSLELLFNFFAVQAINWFRRDATFDQLNRFQIRDWSCQRHEEKRLVCSSNHGWFQRKFCTSMAPVKLIAHFVHFIPQNRFSRTYSNPIDIYLMEDSQN